jgi:hypothetical protein
MQTISNDPASNHKQCSVNITVRKLNSGLLLTKLISLYDKLTVDSLVWSNVPCLVLEPEA